MGRVKTFLAHLVLLAMFLAAALALATWRGGLWPFDPRYSALVTAGGLAILTMGWGLIWLIPVALAAVTRPLVGRIALWPLAVLGFVVLHRALGPTRGFAPLEVLTWSGVVLLYAIPVALALTLGSALGALIRGGRKTMTLTQTQAGPASQG